MSMVREDLEEANITEHQQKNRKKKKSVNFMVDQAIMNLLENVSDDKKDEDEDTLYGKKTVHLV